MRLGEVRTACGCEVQKVSDVAWTVSKPGDAAGVCEDPEGFGLLGVDWAAHAVQVAVQVAEQAADIEENPHIGGELEPSPGYARRWWSFVPSGPASMVDGVLAIGVRKGKRPTSKAELDCYAVQSMPAPFRAAAGYLILNVTDADTPDAYEVIVGTSGLDTCTCDAGRHHKPCKHTAALRALTAVLNARSATPAGAA